MAESSTHPPAHAEITPPLETLQGGGSGVFHRIDNLTPSPAAAAHPGSKPEHASAADKVKRGRRRGKSVNHEADDTKADTPEGAAGAGSSDSLYERARSLGSLASCKGARRAPADELLRQSSELNQTGTNQSEARSSRYCALPRPAIPTASCFPSTQGPAPEAENTPGEKGGTNVGDFVRTKLGRSCALPSPAAPTCLSRRDMNKVGRIPRPPYFSS